MGDGSTKAIGPYQTFKVPEKGLVPVSVKMVLDDAKLSASFHQMLYRYVTVRFVGRALDIINDDMSAKFVLEDGTGKVEVNYWFPTPGEVPKNLREISVGCYVHLVGRMEKKNGHLLVQAFSCWKVADYNDITHHFLSTIHSFVVLGGRVENVVPKKGEMDEGINKHCRNLKTKDKAKGEVKDLNGNESKVAMEYGSGQEVKLLESGNEEEVVLCETQEESLGGRDLQKSIMSVIRRYQSEKDLEGVSLNELIIQLGVDECVLRDTLLQLKEVGEIYETVDDEHYGAT